MTNELLAILGHATVAVTSALVIVLALRPLLRRWVGAQLAYRVWLLVPMAVLAGLLPAPTRPLTLALHAAAGAVSASAVSVASAAGNLVPPFDVKFWLLATWILGAVLAMLRFLVQQRRYVQNLGKLSAVGSGELRAQTNQGSPALVGALRPRIVLPQDFESRYTPHERELVLVHERTHLRRGDAQINALVVLIRCVQWFNPLIHFAASRFRFDQELACDAAVIAKFPDARRCYAGAMLKAQLDDDAQRELSLPIGCYWPNRHPLQERIAMLKLPALSARRRVFASLMIAALTAGTGYASWAAQEPQAVDEQEGPWFQIDGKFFVGDKEIIDHVVLIGAEKWPLIATTGDTPDSSWKLSFTINPLQSDKKHVDLKIEHLGGSITILDATATLNQPVEIFTPHIANTIPAEFHVTGPLTFKGMITPFDRVAMCKNSIRERRTRTLHAFDIRLPGNNISIGGPSLEIRGDRMHALVPEPDFLEIATRKDGLAIDPVRIRAMDLPGQDVSLQIEHFHDHEAVSSEARTVAFDETVEITMPGETVSFKMQPLLPEDLIPLPCRNLAADSAVGH